MVHLVDKSMAKCFIINDLKDVRHARITSSLFGWQEVEAKSDLARLKMVFEYLPDERFMQELEAKRGRGRNDYPVRCVWNAILAGVVYQHETTEKLRRELQRNVDFSEN